MAGLQETPEVDLKKLYADLHALQVRAFGEKWKYEPDGSLTEQSLDMAMQKYAILLIGEAMEVLKETNWRDHKERKPLDIEALREELVDVAIYAIDAATVLFPSYDAFLQGIKKKKEYNERRKDWKINDNNRGSSGADALTTLLAESDN